MSGVLEASESLHARARRFVDAFTDGAPSPEPFEALALDIARYQARHVPAYTKLCARRGLDPQATTSPEDFPAVPADAFRVAHMSAFKPGTGTIVFRTSGTTTGARGEHFFRTTATYDHAAVALGRRHLGVSGPMRVVALAPSPDEAPDSSLAHMISLFGRNFGGPEERTFFLERGVFDLGALDETVSRALVADVPVLLLAASFSFVHFLEALDDAPFRLPPKSRLMLTGGFKGRSREVEPSLLRRELCRALGVGERDLVSEYGMTELSSQFYDDVATDASARPGAFVAPPWARVVPVDPHSLEPVPEGEVGIARITDLLNVDSAVFVQTADQVRDVGGGRFELLGRLPGAQPRGCSLAIEEMMDAAN